jgi:hypothetical protein
MSDLHFLFQTGQQLFSDNAEYPHMTILFLSGPSVIFAPVDNHQCKIP